MKGPFRVELKVAAFIAAICVGYLLSSSAYSCHREGVAENAAQAAWDAEHYWVSIRCDNCWTERTYRDLERGRPLDVKTITCRQCGMKMGPNSRVNE